jgi:APA family basic amino acid/polyamine antiporter
VPLVPLLAILFCVALMTFLSRTTWIAFGIWLLLGLAVYFGYSRRNAVLHGRMPGH